MFISAVHMDGPRASMNASRYHGRDVPFCAVVTIEKIPYRSVQQQFGRSVKVRAPGMFVAMLGRKAASAGGRVECCQTQTTRLSQVGLCGCLTKKPLSLCRHTCGGGVGPVQRDLVSGFLARVVSDNRLDARQAELAWPGAEPLLRRAASSVDHQPARGDGPAVSHALRSVGAGRPPKGIAQAGERAHVVPALVGPGGAR